MVMMLMLMLMLMLMTIENMSICATHVVDVGEKLLKTADGSSVPIASLLMKQTSVVYLLRRFG